MQGKILIVDAIATNRIVLKVKLRTAFYDVLQASTLNEARESAREIVPDLIICAMSLPDGDIADLCAALSSCPMTQHIPVLGVGCDVSTSARIKALRAGVYEVLGRPVDTALLLGRTRSLIRAHNALAEWQLRDGTSRALGLAEQAAEFGSQAHFVMVSDDKAQLQSFAAQLRPKTNMKLGLASSVDLMARAQDRTPPDAYVLVLSQDCDAAREELCMVSALRANAGTRHAGIVVLQTVAESALGANALDLGADDLMSNGFDADELALRLSAVIRRKHLADHLRATVRNGLQAAVFDPLTGLHNRRYAMPHLECIAQHARSTDRPFAILVGDLDHFKRVNDCYGHASGDAVLIEVANRLRQSMRTSDLVARMGGEEFLIVLPQTTLAQAQGAALRICEDISSTPYIIPGHGAPIEVTISIGMIFASSDSIAPGTPQSSDVLLARADKALYAAKSHGRNQVTLGRPAA